MSFVFIIFLCLIFFSGLFILLGSLGEYTSYVETKGEVVEALKCNPCDEGGIPGEPDNAEEEAVVIAYQVEGKTYHLATNLKKSTGTAAVQRNVRVLYNPYFPDDSHIKEGNPFLGAVLVAFSLTGFLILAFL